MEVIVAETAGFCFGVKRAVETVYKQIGQEHDGPIFTYGPIIHNEEVVEDLQKKGVNVIDENTDFSKIQGGTVIIRSHGVSRQVQEELSAKGFHIVDATCPFVKKIHRTVSEQSEKGRTIIIVGNSRHPEVEGIKGWCKEKAIVIESLEEAKALNFPPETKLCVVSQTTFNYNKFEDIVDLIKKIGYDCIVVNTICSATHERQAEAKQLASRTDVMLIIGGRHSSNTQKLFEICRKECNNTYYIQTVKDLNPEWLDKKQIVGITAGASTPNHIIEEVQKYVRIKF